MNQVARIQDENDIADSGGGGMIIAGGITAMVRAEIDMQITTARAYPRSPKKVQNTLLEFVTLDEASAEECSYALPRGGKPVTGPSIRFAEALKQAWGNCRAATEITEINKDLGYVEAVGVFHDLESNVITRIPHRRRITGRNGKVFQDDMILVTANAASSIAMRESILKGVPKPVWRRAYEAVTEVMSGNIETLAVNRDKAIKAFARFGVKPEQVLEALGVAAEEDIVLDHIAVLRGMFSALKNGEETVESMFTKRGEKERDPNYNPLKPAKQEGHDPETGEVQETKSAPTDSGAKQEPEKAAETEKPAQQTAGTTDGPQESTKEPEQASAKPAPADAGTSSETSGSSQPDTKGAGPAEDGGAAQQQADADGGTVPQHSLKERLESYSKALGGINEGGPAKLMKQGQAWGRKWGSFEGDDKKLSDAIYNLHLKRIAGDLPAEQCAEQVRAVIAA